MLIGGRCRTSELTRRREFIQASPDQSSCETRPRRSRPTICSTATIMRNLQYDICHGPELARYRRVVLRFRRRAFVAKPIRKLEPYVKTDFDDQTKASRTVCGDSVAQ